MSLARYLLRRAGFALLLVFVAASAAVVVSQLAPSGCDTGAVLDEDARARCAERAASGLDRPLPVVYVDWLARAARGDLGTSLYYRGRPVAGLIAERALNTAVLASAALLVATAVGIPLGVYTGTRSRGAGAAIVRGGSLMLLSLPPLLASLALMLFAARTGWLPVGGMVSSDVSTLSWPRWFLDVARHLPLPALALAMPFGASLERLQSQSMREAAAAPFVRAARARGVGPLRALLRHAWPLSLRVVLGLYGFMIGALFSGSFVVELLTAWPGLGRLMYEALRAQDAFLVAGCAGIGALFLAIGTFVADVLLAVADPRLRLGARV